jgi:hypothetical protein
MSYKCFILTKKTKHFRAYNAPPSGALVFFVEIMELLSTFIVLMHVCAFLVDEDFLIKKELCTCLNIWQEIVIILMG